jgi:hypothetical protein
MSLIFAATSVGGRFRVKNDRDAGGSHPVTKAYACKKLPFSTGNLPVERAR